MRSRRGCAGPRGDPRARRDRRAPNASAPRASRRARASPPKCSPERAPSAPPSSRVRARRTPGRVAAPPLPRTSPRRSCVPTFPPPYLRSFLLPERRPGGSLARVHPSPLTLRAHSAYPQRTRDPPRNPSSPPALTSRRTDATTTRPSPRRPGRQLCRAAQLCRKNINETRRAPPRETIKTPTASTMPPPTPTTPPSGASSLHDAAASSLAARLHSCVPPKTASRLEGGGGLVGIGDDAEFPSLGAGAANPGAASTETGGAAPYGAAAGVKPPRRVRAVALEPRATATRERGPNPSASESDHSPASPAPRSAGSGSANAARATRRRIQPTSTGPGSPFAKDSVGRSIGSVEGPSSGALPEVVVVPSPFASEARRDARRRSFHAPSSEKHSTLAPPPAFDRATSPSATSPPPRLAPAASRLARLHGAVIAGGLVPDLAPETAYLFRLLAVVPRARAELFERASEREKESDSPKKNKNKRSPGGVNHSDADASREYSPPPPSLLPRASALHLYAAEALAGCFDVACASGDALLHAARASPALLAADRGLARRFAERLARDREVRARDATRRLGVFFEGGGGGSRRGSRRRVRVFVRGSGVRKFVRSVRRRVRRRRVERVRRRCRKW